MDKIAKAISLILNPVFMPLIGIYLIFQTNRFSYLVPQQIFTIYLVIVFFSILVPLSLFPLLTVWKLIGSIHLNERKDRFIPLTISTVCFYITHFLMVKMGAPKLMVLFTFSISLSTLSVLLITIFWKISLHLTGIGGITALILSLVFYNQSGFFAWLVVFFVLSGLLASVRLYLQVHSLAQVGAGFAVGFLCVLLTFLYFPLY